MRTILFLFPVILLVSCSFLEGPEISVKTYAAFKSRCMLSKEVYANDTLKQNETIALLMNNYDIDSVRLQNFIAYYKKNPDQWLSVEEAIFDELEKLKARGE
jgi:hypothetical protein